MSGASFFKVKELKQQSKLHLADHTPYRGNEDKQYCIGPKIGRQWYIPLLPSEELSKP